MARAFFSEIIEFCVVWCGMVLIRVVRVVRLVWFGLVWSGLV